MERKVLAVVTMALLASTGCGGGGGGSTPEPDAVSRVVFSRAVPGGQQDLYIVDADGTGLVLLAASPDQEFFEAMTADDRVIFSRRVSSADTDIYSVPVDGSAGPVPLTDVPENLERFRGLAADNRVIFERSAPGPDGTQSDLYSVPADGSRPAVPLATDVDDERFSAVTPGNRVIFQRPPFSGNLFSVPADGSAGPTLLARHLANCFTAADNRVVFEQTVGDSRDLFAIAADGRSDPVPLATSPDDERLEWVFPGGFCD